MITFDKGTITEQELRDMTKNYLGIRYKTEKNHFVAYFNGWTVLVDLVKKIWGFIVVLVRDVKKLIRP